jgi:hypothetical protein
MQKLSTQSSTLRRQRGVVQLPQVLFCLVICLLRVGSAPADVTPSEFHQNPTLEGWTLVAEQGNLSTWVSDSIFFQDLPRDCAPGPVCDLQGFTRSVQAYNGQARWFYEYRVSATSNSSEIAAGGPTILAAFNAAGNLYHATLSSDRIKLSGDIDLPVLHLDVQPGVPHTIRLELYNDPPPATFHWYVDSVLVLEGPADSPFPDFDSRITWHGQTWMQPTLNAWYYIRFGDIPLPESGDFNSDAAVSQEDYFYFHECMERTASGEPAAPSCAWANFDADADVDMLDFQRFQAAFTGTEQNP